MRVWRSLIGAVVAAALCTAVTAATRLNPTHPDAYTVREGDTLWDISARFLNEPWRWQEVWQGNPQIKNPDLIYPGDVIYLTYDGNGQPELRLSRQGRPVIKLSPRVRSEARQSGAIPTIPIDAIRQFLSRPMVVTENQLEDAPYIVSLGKERLVGSAGARVYVRGVEDGAERRLYTVLREGEPYLDPDAPDGEVLGYEAIHIADATVELTGDPSTLRLLRTRREVLIGDRMVPAEEDALEQSFMPHAPTDDVTGQIINVVEGVTQIGRYQVVVLSVGKDSGVDKGAVLAVYQQGVIINDEMASDPNATLPEPDAEIEFDPDRQRGLEGFTMMLDRLARDVQGLVQPKDYSYRQVTLPVERAGTVMVFRAFDRVSYALVMDASAPLHVADWVKTPPN